MDSGRLFWHFAVDKGRGHEWNCTFSKTRRLRSQLSLRASLINGSSSRGVKPPRVATMKRNLLRLYLICTLEDLAAFGLIRCLCCAVRGGTH